MCERSVNNFILVVAGLVLLLGGGCYFATEHQGWELAESGSSQNAPIRLIAEETHAESSAALQNQASDQTQPAQNAAGRAAMEAVFQAQQDAWNRGDVDAFMEHYWKSEQLTFSSGGKTTRGWKATLDRYRERYPTREAMGRLTLGEFEVMPLGNSAAFVLGEWKLDRQDEPVSGNFTLVLRKIDGRWVIVHDHTSRVAE